MFFHLQYIHLFRPFLKYAPNASPLPSHVSPRRICTANAGSISKLMRLYKKNWGLRQICNIAVYMLHSACTIHLLNLPEKTAKRDVIHGVKQLEEIAEDWLCARRTLSIISVLARKWNRVLPEDAAFVLHRTDEKYGSYSTSEVPSPRSNIAVSPPISDTAPAPHDQGEYSNLRQYAHQQVIPQQAPAQSLGNRMANNQPVHMLSNNRLQASQADLGVDAAAMNFNADALSGWSPPRPTTTSPTSMFPTAFASAPHMTNRAMTQGVNMDSQDWFIHDSARWAQGFESWDTGSGGGGGNSMFMFQDNGGRNGGNSANVRADSGDPLAGFDGLAETLNAGGWLPGLD